METLFEHLCRYADSGRISFAMPGHKGGRGFSEEFKSRLCTIDVTELADTENLHSPGEVMSDALRRLSEIYKSGRSYFLTGGSSEGIHIMIHAAASSGKLLVNRTCHRSVINCCVLCGAQPVFIPQRINPELEIPECAAAQDVEECIEKIPDIGAVLITSPSFYGQVADIAGIAKVCHAHGIPLLVDEAHGAHFAADGMPESAICCGADMVAQSAHKTLNALNQAAFLHIKSNILDVNRIDALTSMVGTTSPSYPMVASAQLAAEELCGGKWRELAEYISKKKVQILKKTAIVMPTGNIDPTRVVFCFKNYSITGYEAERILSERYNIDAEMSDCRNVVCIVTPSNTYAEIDALFDAAEEICAQTECACAGYAISIPPQPIAASSPRDAFYAKGEFVPFCTAAGRISKTAVAAYPPGIALIGFGERITDDMIEYIESIRAQGALIEGLTPDGNISVVAE